MLVECILQELSMRDSRADVEIREEVDIVSVDPRFVERQRNRYASRGVALVVLLNGVAAIVLLTVLSQRSTLADGRSPTQ
jgi:hypothetical protein